MGRLRSTLGAALVLGLLVLPPAISAGESDAPAPPQGAGSADTGSAAGDDGFQTSGSSTEQAGATADGGADVVVQGASSSGASPKRKLKARARFASSLSVSMGDNFYSPPAISIGVGDTVTWTNEGKATH